MMFRGRDYAVVSDIIHSEMQGQRKWHLHFLPIHWLKSQNITCRVDLCRARSWRRRVWKDLAPSQNQFTSTPHWRGVSSHQPALATTGPSLLHTGTSTHTERHAGECCTSVVCIKYENTPPPHSLGHRHSVCQGSIRASTFFRLSENASHYCVVNGLIWQFWRHRNPLKTELGKKTNKKKTEWIIYAVHH